jgi:antitoxin (DNA-binding transcriptional repressor) of toxin-antitoxin stability system
MTIRTTVDEASAHLRELLQAALRGEVVLIASDDDGTDERVVRLVAVSDGQRGAEFGSGEGLFHMAEDFDDLLPDFDAYR